MKDTIKKIRGRLNAVPWFIIVLIVLSILIGLSIRFPLVMAACNMTVRNTTACYAEPGNQSDVLGVFEYSNEVLDRGAPEGGNRFLGLAYVLIIWLVFFMSFLPRVDGNPLKALAGSGLIAFFFSVGLGAVGISPWYASMLTSLGTMIGIFGDYLRRREVV